MKKSLLTGAFSEDHGIKYFQQTSPLFKTKFFDQHLQHLQHAKEADTTLKESITYFTPSSAINVFNQTVQDHI